MELEANFQFLESNDWYTMVDFQAILHEITWEKKLWMLPISLRKLSGYLGYAIGSWFRC